MEGNSITREKKGGGERRCFSVWTGCVMDAMVLLPLLGER